MHLFFLILGVIIFIGFYSLYKTNIWEKEMRKLNDSRPALSEEEYTKILINKGYNRKHIAIVYHEIQKMLGLDFFSIYPEDDIYVVYGMDDLDDVELFDLICNKLKIRKVEQKDIDKVDKKMDIVNAEYILTLTEMLAKEN